MPVVFDVTHSLQLPGAGDGVTAGLAQYIEPLACAGVAAGVDGVFLEVHDDPSNAKSDAENALRSSKVTLQNGKRSAMVAVEKGTARVQRPGQKPQEFPVPAGVIVTSAPDWTDVVLLCRRFDHVKGGKQTFAALWIHPEQPALSLKLSIEHQGYATVTKGQDKIKLTAFLIHLRNQSPYYAWATLDGTLVL